MTATTTEEVARELGAELRGTYEEWTDWRELGDWRSVRAKLAADCDHSLSDDGDWFGTLHWGDRFERGRPSGCDGAARKVRTRQGYVWWQPPGDVKSDSDALARLEERVRGYFLEHWSYMGVVLEVRAPACQCCGAEKVERESVWAVESDAAADYLAELVADLIPRGAA